MVCLFEIKIIFITMKADIDVAVEAARKAFHRYSKWRTMDASQRGLLMLKLAELMDSQAKYLAELETLDCGKPVKIAEEEVHSSAGVLRYYAGKADKILGNTIPAGNVTPFLNNFPVVPRVHIASYYICSFFYFIKTLVY